MTHPNKDNQAERAAFEAHAKSRNLTLQRARIGSGYYLADTNEAWAAWQAARAASPALDAEGLPELGSHAGMIDFVDEFGRLSHKPGYTAEQVRQAQRDAIAADRLARQGQQPARASIDTSEFVDLLDAWQSAESGEPAFDACEKIIAHINAWGGVEQ